MKNSNETHSNRLPRITFLKPSEIMAYKSNHGSVRINDNEIIITDALGREYPIACHRVTDPLDLVKWVAHLTEKVWMTRELIHDFTLAVMQLRGWGREITK